MSTPGRSSAAPVLNPQASPLAAYLKATGISYRSFARALGTTDGTVAAWAEGHTVPTLDSAYLIELVTKGVIPMEAWMGMKALRSTMAARLVKMPEEVKRAIRMDSGGLPFEGEEKTKENGAPGRSRQPRVPGGRPGSKQRKRAEAAAREEGGETP